jgi:hypothetical protein
MIPHTLVLEAGLHIYKIYNGLWLFGRSTVEELCVDLRAVLRRRRPDRDISSAEQRIAWGRPETGFRPLRQKPKRRYWRKRIDIENVTR